MVRAGVQVRAVVRVVRPLDRTNYSVQRAIPNPSLALTQSTLYTHSSVSSVLLARRRTVVVVYILLQLRLLLYHINYILQCDIGNNIIQHGNVRTRTLILIVIRHCIRNTINTNTYIIIVIIILN